MFRRRKVFAFEDLWCANGQTRLLKIFESMQLASTVFLKSEVKLVDLDFGIYVFIRDKANKESNKHLIMIL